MVSVELRGPSCLGWKERVRERGGGRDEAGRGCGL